MEDRIMKKLLILAAAVFMAGAFYVGSVQAQEILITTVGDCLNMDTVEECDACLLDTNLPNGLACTEVCIFLDGAQACQNHIVSAARL